jgi:FlaA1/EpsC-like NDP-sugar epimerase
LLTLKLLFSQTNSPRWLVLAIDSVTTWCAFILAFLVRFEFNLPAEMWALAKTAFPVFFLLRFITFLIGKTYSGMIRYTSSQDALRIFMVVTSGSVLLEIISLGYYYWSRDQFLIPHSIIILEYLLTLFVMLVGRIAVKLLFTELERTKEVKRRVLVFGAGRAGMITKRTIDRDFASNRRVVAFIDDDPGKVGKLLEGVEIIDSKILHDYLTKNDISEVIIAINQLSGVRKAQIAATCLDAEVRVTHVPPSRQWIGGELTLPQLRNIKIEELLDRETIQIKSPELLEQMKNAVVLVTGGAGSIGSELVRQIIGMPIKKIYVLDQAETPLFELGIMLDDVYDKSLFELVIGDVCDEQRMRRLMEHARPDIVFHAAAYKHVPLMEDNPCEAVHTNVSGTRVMADLANGFGVKVFVLVSTDKAVNPANVMGASKRAAEIYVQNLSRNSNCKYITTRFGNVLGSNGSVIPIFSRQILEGGPVTVTHPEITRFFMTIPEAANLVLEASAMGEGSEIFAFDMGQSVRISDLAKRMVLLSGLVPGRDIEIQFSGLRPGEKLYEEVLSSKENSLPTHHPKILRASVRDFDTEKVVAIIDALLSECEVQNNESVIQSLKKLIPEYKSMNSKYEKYD